MIKSFKIGNKKISDNSPAFIIAEIGINHSGSKAKCLKLIIAAHKSGADAVKLQIANPEYSYAKNHPSFKEFKNKDLKDKDLIKLISYAKSLGLIMFATPGDFKSLERIKKLKMPAIKISSGLLSNLPLIKEASNAKVPVIFSTGMSYLKEVHEAINICKIKQKKIAILKCTSIYPAPIKYLNLKGIKKYKKIFKVPIGYSDHAMGIDASVNAVACGAKIIEKHFTLNKLAKGADHRISVEPKEFKLMVSKIRNLETMLGNGILKPTKEEEANRKNNLRKLVTLKEILKGEKISLNNISLKRINSNKKSIELKNFYKILGRRALRNLKKEEVLSMKDINKH
ncbi:N-acetylneuraminate synthase family protein [Pelagibacteraceae bacterium]|nr:N-acetylneuraminate synthase family protein [Pelagibacteraceae bacterium]|tara:strand:- start:431 stop:1453 length:1023 start_codon:yes stop_codon:yes gene_type:complete